MRDNPDCVHHGLTNYREMRLELKACPPYANFSLSSFTAKGFESINFKLFIHVESKNF